MEGVQMKHTISLLTSKAPGESVVVPAVVGGATELRDALVRLEAKRWARYSQDKLLGEGRVVSGFKPITELSSADFDWVIDETDSTANRQILYDTKTPVT